MRIVVLDAATVVGHGVDLAFLKEFGEVAEYDLTAPEEIVPRLQGADAVICNKVRITAEVMAACPTLKYVGLFATGYNNIDVDYAAAHGVTVCNVPGYSTEAVAQHTFALLLALTDRVHEYNATVAQGDWVRSRTFSYFNIPLMELCGKTIGIVGYGAIGRRVGDMARAFGMKVLVHGRRPIPDADPLQLLTHLRYPHAQITSSQRRHMASAAASSSSPSMQKRRLSPQRAPRLISERSRLASAVFPLHSTRIAAAKPFAADAKSPAGRAWIPCSSLMI